MPQGSILGPLFIVIYINDLTDNLNGNVKLFVDDTSLFSEICDPGLYFNSLVVEKGKTQKHLGLKLDEKLNFKEYLKDKFVIVNKGIGTLKKLSNYLPRHSLVTLYKAFIRPYLDYADIIYDKPNDMSICNKIGSLQYNAVLAITGAIRGSSKEKLYKELGFEHLSSRRWLRKLCVFYKIVVNKSPNYLYNCFNS